MLIGVQVARAFDQVPLNLYSSLLKYNVPLQRATPIQLQVLSKLNIRKTQSATLIPVEATSRICSRFSKLQR